MSDRKERPSRLGRGLASLLGEAEINVSGGLSQRSLPVSSLVPGPLQPRRGMAEDALDELTTSIRTHGVLQPILVRPSPGEDQVFQIVAGERRWRAAQRAGLHEVPVHIRALDDATALAASLIENLQRQDLNAIEEAEGLRRLLEEFGLTQEMVANSIGKSRSHVANMMRLLTLPTAVQHDVRRGALSAGHARALLTHSDPAAAANLVLSRGLNVRQTEALSKSPDKHPPQYPKSETLIDVDALERELTSLLGLRVRILAKGGQGEICLVYKSLDQLDGLVKALTANATSL